MTRLGPDPPVGDPEMMPLWLARQGNPALIDRAGRVWLWTPGLWGNQHGHGYAHRHSRWGISDLVVDFAPIVVVKDRRLLHPDIRMEPVPIRDVRVDDLVVLDDGMLAAVVAHTRTQMPCGHRHVIRNQYGHVVRRGETTPVLRVMPNG